MCEKGFLSNRVFLGAFLKIQFIFGRTNQGNTVEGRAFKAVVRIAYRIS